jgi:hypothetical protein
MTEPAPQDVASTDDCGDPKAPYKAKEIADCFRGSKTLGYLGRRTRP